MDWVWSTRFLYIFKIPRFRVDYMECVPMWMGHVPIWDRKISIRCCLFTSSLSAFFCTVEILVHELKNEFWCVCNLQLLNMCTSFTSIGFPWPGIHFQFIPCDFPFLYFCLFVCLLLLHCCVVCYRYDYAFSILTVQNRLHMLPLQNVKHLTKYTICDGKLDETWCAIWMLWNACNLMQIQHKTVYS